MKNADMPAIPQFVTHGPDGGIIASYDFAGGQGLSKREQFAMAAMQGLLSNAGGPIQANPMSGFGWCNTDVYQVAKEAVKCADALLKALENEAP